MGGEIHSLMCGKRDITYEIPPFKGMDAVGRYREKANKYFENKWKLNQLNLETLFKRIGIRDESRSKSQSMNVWLKAIKPAMDANGIEIREILNRTKHPNDVRKWKLKGISYKGISKIVV